MGSGDFASLTIVADDLTGACDTGALFAGGGAVTVDVWPCRPRAGGVCVVDTESRGLDAQDAAARVGAVAGAGAHFKKIDSTLRGRIGAEIDALMAATRATTALVCPALPTQGRQVVERVLTVDGVPVAETAHAQDPQFPKPASSSSVVDLLRPQLDRPLGWVPLAQVREPTGALAARLGRLAGTVLVADAETDEDLDRLAAAAVALSPPPLLVGSAGLARGEADGVLVTGGETAAALYAALEADGLDLLGIVVPGVALGRLHTAVCPPLPLLTKAGGFGGPGLLVELLCAPA